MQRLDGNAIGGLLLEIFGTEMTMSTGVCGTCGATGPIAELHVYVRAPGAVVRCARCEAVLMKIVRAGNRAWLDLRGLRSLELNV